MCLEYSVAPRDLVPGLDDRDVETVFEQMVGLHADRVREHERKEAQQRLRRKMGWD